MQYLNSLNKGDVIFFWNLSFIISMITLENLVCATERCWFYLAAACMLEILQFLGLEGRW